MNIFCPECGERWDMDLLHEEAQARYGIAPVTERQQAEYKAIYSQVVDDFNHNGCTALRAIYPEADHRAM